MSVVRMKMAPAFQPLWVPSRNKACYGGRASAKSHHFAYRAVEWGMQEPIRGLCCRETQVSIKDSVKLLLDDYVKKLDPDGTHYRSTKTEITGRNGTTFVFAGLKTNPDSVKSKEGFDLAWVEEASTVSRNSLDILRPTLRKPGSELWYVWNRRFKTDPVDEMFLGPAGPPPDSQVWGVTWRDNPWFPDVLRDEMAWDWKRDPERAKHIWEGELLTNSEALVFRNWRVERFELPADTIWYLGADWGYAADPTVLIKVALDPVNRRLFIRDEIWKLKLEIEDTPAAFDRMIDSRVWTISADSSRPEIISYMRSKGYSMKPARKGPGSVLEGIRFLQGYEIIVHPECVHSIIEFGTYSWKLDKITQLVLPQLRDEHNHVIDAVRYATDDARRSLTSGASGLVQPVSTEQPINDYEGEIVDTSEEDSSPHSAIDTDFYG